MTYLREAVNVQASRAKGGENSRAAASLSFHPPSLLPEAKCGPLARAPSDVSETTDT